LSLSDNLTRKPLLREIRFLSNTKRLSHTSKKLRPKAALRKPNPNLNQEDLAPRLLLSQVVEADTIDGHGLGG
jgi:hypothetical protein